MEKSLKCVQLLSLKEMALGRVAVTLCSGSDVVLSFVPTDSFEYLCGDRVRREASEDKIKDKILKLELPEELTKQMNDIVRPIALEVIAWKENQLSFFNWALPNVIALLDSIKLCWTTSGTINFRQTAEQLLLCDELDVGQRYEIACRFCLEDSIPLYWEELSEEEKGNYGKSKGPPYWWSCILKGEHSELDYLARKSGRNLTFHQFAFEYSAAKGYKTAAEYFFQKLTLEEREYSLMWTAHAVIAHRTSGLYTTEKSSELLRYLLSVMTPKQQREIIPFYPIDVFLCFLHWPLRDLFSDNASLLWTFLPPSEYFDLMKEIEFRCREKSLYFPNIFKEFFMESPLDFKKRFVDEYSYFGCSPAFRFLDLFFKHEDSESIEAMFRSLDAADRGKFLFQRPVLELFYDFVLADRWHLVEVCLREATLTKEEKGRLKDAFARFLAREGKSVRYKRFFDETDVNSDQREKGQKRKLENGYPEQ